ncbi:MAG TPA: MYXO-CTERM sorting domain-containing protein [Polyangiaceae bacterium]|nr:MYXO-CTERM sorting domain-containing protein [Polyangiaceae bacterium]
MTAASPVRAAGTWTAAPVNPGVGQAFGLWMLTDGRVISHGKALNNWVVLTPDKKGSYANGTWKSVASSAYARGGAQEHVLKDGRFFEAGGEYIYVWPPGGSSSDYNTVEIYDPVANTWTLEAPGLYGDIGDTGSAVMADGRIFDSTRNSSSTQIYDPTTNVWTAAAKSPLGSGDENAWATLQNGGILAVGYSKAGAAVYNPATNTWTKTTVPAGWDTGDTAGISLMFDGRVIVYGFGQNYLYTPGATAADAGTWALGPQMLNGDEAEDEFTDTLPNGKVWASLVTMTYGPGVVLQEFDPTTNTVSSATPPPDTGNPYPIGYLNLPNGQVMVTASSKDWLYTPDTQPDDSWRPTVSSVTFDNGTYTLTGTQISGLINGGDEGDDMTMSQNYPIIWLTDSTGDVYYCRSFNFSNMMPSKGSAPETAQFTTPAGLPAGSYNLFVSAVGVQSKTGFPFTVGVGGTSTGSAGAGAGGSSGAAGANGISGANSTGGAGGTSVAGQTGSAGSSAAGGDNTSSAGSTGNGVGGASNAAGSSSSSGGVNNAGGGSPGTSSSTTDDTSDGSHDSAGCGCSTVGTRGRAPAFMGLGLLGLALLRIRRRRS